MSLSRRSSPFHHNAPSLINSSSCATATSTMLAGNVRARHIVSRVGSFARTSCQLECLHLFTSKTYQGNNSSRNISPRRPKISSSPTRCIRYSTSLAQVSARKRTITSSENTPPAYTPPTTGILSVLPSSWIPYAELIRIDKPAGTNYLFLPCMFSTLLAAPLSTASPLTVLGTTALFYAGAVIMRGAGCTINDLWDRNLDPKVARTRLRPIARGAISVRQAIPYLGAQLMAGLAILLQFPQECFFYAVPSLLLVATYPLAKRVTYYPQFVLGLTFSWGAFLGFPALGIDLLANTPALVSSACLYSSCVAWTLIYDMIYAYQDIKDDAKAGIKSIALAQEANAKTFLSSIAVVQVGLLGAAGFTIGAGPVFYAGVCGGAASTLAYMIRVVDLSSVMDCWTWFKRGAWFTGGAISCGLAAEYYAQYAGLYRIDKPKLET